MANIQENLKIAKKSAMDCYEAALVVYKQAGFEVWKKREIAYFVQARCQKDGALIDSNMMARPGSPTTINLTVSSDSLEKDALQGYFDQLSAAFQKSLG